MNGHDHYEEVGRDLVSRQPALRKRAGLAGRGRTPGPSLHYGILFLLLLTCGCPKSPSIINPSPSPFDASGLDSTRAMEEVKGLLHYSPRDTGTEGAAAAAAYLRERLEEAGVSAHLESFTAPSPLGPTTPFHNVVGLLPGPAEGIIVLGSHFDTKAGVGEGFVGANDSGSSSGLLLELARLLASQVDKQYQGPTLRFVFFDGEECLRHYGPTDGFQGSQYHAQKLVDDGLAKKVLGVIILDMIGDKDLSVMVPQNGTPALVAGALKAATQEGLREYFRLYQGSIGDDHVAFLERGMPAVDLIDFEFGSRPGLNDYWHTTNDTLDKLSTESLERVGRVTVRLLNQVMENPGDRE